MNISLPSREFTGRVRSARRDRARDAMLLLFVYLLLAIGFSFLCSMLESVLLSVPRSHVAVLRERGSRAGRLLDEMKRDVDRPLAAILTLNTFAHTLGAAGVGAQAAIVWGKNWVGVVSFVVTLLVLIFSEIIPKTIGAVHAKALAPFAAVTIRFLVLVLAPAVYVCDRISKALTPRRGAGSSLSRDEVRTMATMAHDEGAIDRDESRLIRNMIALRETTVYQVMTPRTVVFTLPASMTIGGLVEGSLPRFSRVPIVETSLDAARGFVHRHALIEAIAERRFTTALRDLARPLRVVPEKAALRNALDAFVDSREHMLLVVDEYGGGAGIVTLEDVMETLLGVEIVDETDHVIDMQQLARGLTEARPKKVD